MKHEQAGMGWGRFFAEINGAGKNNDILRIPTQRQEEIESQRLALHLIRLVTANAEANLSDLWLVNQQKIAERAIALAFHEIKRPINSP